MPEYKITFLDIVKGIISLVVILFVLLLGFGLFAGGSEWVFGWLYEKLHPLVLIVLMALALIGVALLTGFLKTIEAGFSPWKFLKKTRNDL